jgi:hypothetical protein
MYNKIKMETMTMMKNIMPFKINKESITTNENISNSTGSDKKRQAPDVGLLFKTNSTDKVVNNNHAHISIYLGLCLFTCKGFLTNINLSNVITITVAVDVSIEIRHRQPISLQ